tara:strand:- start:946 stop:1194 length:249 start_codon:yes stop_codon:yes gene_type:complete
MDEAIPIILLDFLLHGFCYYTGKAVLKVISLGRVSIEPKKKYGRKKPVEEHSHRFGVSDWWTSAIGLAFWIGVALVVAILME